jgi:hypothetical protein
MDNDVEQINAIYIGIDRYEALIEGLFCKCEKWITGTITGEQLVATYNAVYKRAWMIKELNGKPDDYDWTQVSRELRDKGDKLCIRFRLASEVMRATRLAVFALRDYEHQRPIVRSYEFAKCMVECGYTVDRLYI